MRDARERSRGTLEEGPREGFLVQGAGRKAEGGGGRARLSPAEGGGGGGCQRDFCCLLFPIR